ncbi:hypothetical protein Tco_0934307 [Tanacetum coccineum]
MTKSSTKELIEPYNKPERVLHSLRKLFKTTSFDHSSSPEFELFSDNEEQVEEEIVETMTEPTMEDKYCPPSRTAKRMEEINNFQQEPDETLYQVWERFKELSLRCPQHYLTNMQEEIKKVNGRVYAAQVGCELCGGPHYSKDCSLKEEGNTFKEAYYTQFGVPFQNARRYRSAAPGFNQRDNGNPSYQERRQTMEESLSNFMAEFTKRHDEKSSLIKE